ncbi:hypothetical protein CROQUDRAFT_131597 [Cronartium quercuum f. sp. fusiforme G11]|uniref:Uncharacterized protein n=1 Tax=Cronartium quercuum f. sp. fusiforme G11 TaxID=708437 RepID=A0A9P6TEU9_9BASI|nr:hypothetical protein CROQUDRAFT_131597 [Cronartium quercuum f. sp. fusiforme G11]
MANLPMYTAKGAVVRLVANQPSYNLFPAAPTATSPGSRGTNAPFVYPQVSNSAVTELHDFTNGLLEAQSSREDDIESTETLAFRHDLGSFIEHPHTPNSIAPSGISNGPAINSDYPPSDETEIPNKFVAKDIDLDLVYSGFVDNHFGPPLGVVSGEKRGVAESWRQRDGRLPSLS